MSAEMIGKVRQVVLEPRDHRSSGSVRVNRVQRAVSGLLARIFEWLISPNPNIVAIQRDPGEARSPSCETMARASRYVFPAIS